MNVEPEHESPMLLTDFLEKVYLAHNPGLATKTIFLYGNTIRKFSESLGHAATTDDFNDLAVATLMRELRDKGQRAATVNKERSQLVAMWRAAHTVAMVRRGPLVKRLVEPEYVPTSLTAKQVKKLLKACEELKGFHGRLPDAQTFAAMIAIQFATGERVGAVSQLEWSDLQKDILTIRGELRKGGRKTIVRQLPQWVMDYLKPIRKPVSTHVFPFRPNTTSIQHYYSDIFELAGVPRPKGKSSHLLRATHATLLTIAGGDATKSLGHSSSEITQKSYLDPRMIPDDNHLKLPNLSDLGSD